MPTKKEKLAHRQSKNQIKRLANLADEGKVKNPEIAGALAPLTDTQASFYNEIMPLVKASLKTSPVYYLVPYMQVTDIYQEKGRWFLSSKYVLETAEHKFGAKANHSLKALLDTDQIAIFCNDQGKVFMPDIEQVIVEKEVTKTVSTGIKQKDIDKAIKSILHEYKDDPLNQSFLDKAFEKLNNQLK